MKRAIMFALRFLIGFIVFVLMVADFQRKDEEADEQLTEIIRNTPPATMPTYITIISRTNDGQR